MMTTRDAQALSARRSWLLRLPPMRSRSTRIPPLRILLTTGSARRLRLFSRQGEVDEGGRRGEAGPSQRMRAVRHLAAQAAPRHVRSLPGSGRGRRSVRAGRGRVFWAPQAVGDPLERRPAVVVEAATRRGAGRSRCRDRSSPAGRRRSGCRRLGRDARERPGPLLCCLAAGRDLVIQDAERVRSDPPPAVFAEAAGAFLQEGAEGRDQSGRQTGQPTGAEEERLSRPPEARPGGRSEGR